MVRIRGSRNMCATATTMNARKATSPAVRADVLQRVAVLRPDLRRVAPLHSLSVPNLGAPFDELGPLCVSLFMSSPMGTYLIRS